MQNKGFNHRTVCVNGKMNKIFTKIRPSITMCTGFMGRLYPQKRISPWLVIDSLFIDLFVAGKSGCLAESKGDLHE